jgi:hypothetical protein
LKADEQRDIILQTVDTLRRKGALPIALIGDNCAVNKGMYRLIGGPGEITLEGMKMFLLYDYVHIFKNIRNNWYTELTRKLVFTFEGKEYLACWADLITLYEEDSKTSLRLTKLTRVSINPKPLQRQSVPLVCNVFNDKTVAAFKTLQWPLEFNEGTALFVSLINDWFKMMNVKDTVSCIKLKDETRVPWTLDCKSFSYLEKICDVIDTCKWTGGKGRKQKLTLSTANAFVSTTKTAIAASKHILKHHDHDYVLPAVWADEPVEKFFGVTRVRTGGNFYIDIKDVESAAKVQRFHQLMKKDIMPEGCKTMKCAECSRPLDGGDLDLLNETTMQKTQELLSSDSALKDKVV